VDPDYPYIAKGDYDCDSLPDWAVLVSDEQMMTRLAIISGKTPRRVEWWTEDMRGAAIRRFPRQVFGAMKDEEALQVDLPCDGVEAEWFEKATQVIYRDKNRWQQVWTAD
jgi:hypothetical protein